VLMLSPSDNRFDSIPFDGRTTRPQSEWVGDIKAAGLAEARGTCGE
jgi:hypothetical protein